MKNKRKNNYNRFAYTKAYRKKNIFDKIASFIKKLRSDIEIKKFTNRRNKYLKSFYNKSKSGNNKTDNKSAKNIVVDLLENKIFNKVIVTTLSVTLFLIIANFLVLGMRQVSSPALIPMDIKTTNTAQTYNKVLDNAKDIAPKSQMKEMNVKKTTPNLEKATDNFYASLASDDTLSGDGTIGIEYDEYEIKEGDNLSSISKKIGATLDTIVSVNKMSNANKLRPGQKISIPNRNGLLYTVKKDETLEDIADKYDVSLSRILSFNKIEDMDNIDVGKDIFLPGARYTLDERIEKFGQMFSIPLTTITRISSVFGYRTDPFTGNRTKHTGVDLPGILNTPVYAARRGTVIYAGYSGGYGNLVIVRHDKGYTTYYGHLNSIVAREGQTVGVGTIIGRMGSTGRSTGSHLHFEIRQSGVALNPMDFIPIKKYLKKR